MNPTGLKLVMAAEPDAAKASRFGATTLPLILFPNVSLRELSITTNTIFGKCVPSLVSGLAEGIFSIDKSEARPSTSILFPVTLNAYGCRVSSNGASSYKIPNKP